MLISSISNRKLHCCLITLIFFILIFLSLPLLLIYLANTSYEKAHPLNEAATRTTNQVPNGNVRQHSDGSTNSTDINPTNSTNINSTNSTDISPTNGTESLNGEAPNPIGSSSSNQLQSDYDCIQFAFQANLSTVEENIRCPDGYFPCDSCSRICIEQNRNCNGIPDCPDKSDESSCHDTSGALTTGYFKPMAKANKLGLPKGSASAFAKPDSCTMPEFEKDKCPCVYNDASVIICEKLGLTSVPNNLSSSVYKIRMQDNSISSIDNVAWPESLKSLVLTNNRITHINRSAFEKALNLSKLYLSHNEISYIDNDAFEGLSGLTWLNIESNKLQTFDSRCLLHTPQVARVYLSENMIDLPEQTRFGHCKNLKELILDHNRISIIRSHWFSNMSSLNWLSLMYNQISIIEPGSFDWNYDLNELNLSFNMIKVINRQMFAHKLNIERLYLGGNPLQPLPVDAFIEIAQLKSLNLSDVDFDYINRGTFSYLTQMDYIYFSKFRYCHYATHVRVCRPLTDGLSSVDELLAFPILKYAVWIVASVCSLGNVLVFIWRSVSPHEDRTLSLFVKNLSIADLMMGVYLSAIGWQDWKFQHNFGRHAIEWMSSWTCTAIGFLAILSSELSVFILTIITIERYRSIISISRFEEEAQKRRARIYVALAWLFSILIASYPFVDWLQRKSGYYATNGLCLPLHIDQPFSAGWQYSAFIYLGINFLAVMVIMALYVHMYSMIMDGRQVARPVLFKAEKREDAILAVRFFFIVITDCLCWIPIVVIKIMALANVSISSSIYGWLVVFIIPINSALNPIVYTLAAPTSLRSAVCRFFERICYKLDKLTSRSSNYSSQSSTESGANLADSHTIGTKKRKNTGGSNSTTCDTFDTSVASQSKASVESALIHHNHQFCSPTVGASHSQLNPGIPKSLSSLSPSKPMLDDDGGGGDCEQEEDDCGSVGCNSEGRYDKFYHRYHHAMAGGEKSALNRPYGYLSMYKEGANKHRIINDRALDYNVGDEQQQQRQQQQLVSTYWSRRRNRRLAAYDSLERRTSIEEKGHRTERYCDDGYNGRLNARRFTNPSYEGEDNINHRGGGRMVMHLMDASVAEESDDERSPPISAAARQSAMSTTTTTTTAATTREKSYVFLSTIKSDCSSNIIRIDISDPQAATGHQHNGVSLSSKDSHTCLLSQNDSC